MLLGNQQRPLQSVAEGSVTSFISEHVSDEVPEFVMFVRYKTHHVLVSDSAVRGGIS